jgi:hypothetical protein
MLRIEAVAGVAVLRQNGPHIPIELDLGCIHECGREGEERERELQADHGSVTDPLNTAEEAPQLAPDFGHSLL